VLDARFLLATAAFSLSLGGCLGCNIAEREARWQQEDVPLLKEQGAKFEMDDLWGRVDRQTDGNLTLFVWSHSEVTHEELVKFAAALFEANDWPPPRLDQAEEYHSCSRLN
jgi:hypothetical protein